MCKVMAEIGVNWRNLDEADKMIKEAADAGADIAKFQVYENKGFPIGSQLYNIALTQKDIAYLFYRCRSHGIEFLATPMYPEAVGMLDPFVKRWKVRYMDRRNEDILSLCRSTGKEMLISGDNLYCVPEYPPQNAPIERIPEQYCGVSSHYPDINVVEKWAKQGIEYLEVHVKRDNYDPAWCCPDNHVSITMSELAELCRRLKQ
jgi:sialic acid synthase SpsE